jgi:hypothetical protein
MAKENTENQAKKRGLEDLRSRFAERYPDRKYDADDDLYNDVYGELDENDARLKELEEANKNYADTEGKLTNMFKANPITADLLISMAEEGKDPIVYLVEMYGKEGIEAIINDSEKAEAIAEANKKYHEKAAKSAQMEEERDKNIAESFAMEDAMLEAGEITEEDLARVHDSLDEKYQNLMAGKWTKEDLLSELRSLNYDADVEEARQVGEVTGRNQKIEEKRRGKAAGDGLPVLGGGGSAPVNRKTENKYGALGRQRKSMFD